MLGPRASGGGIGETLGITTGRLGRGVRGVGGLGSAMGEGVVMPRGASEARGLSSAPCLEFFLFFLNTILVVLVRRVVKVWSGVIAET